MSDNSLTAQKSNIVLILVLVALYAMHLFTIRHGAPWAGSGSDLGLAVIHGLNLLEGASFFDTSAYVTPQILEGYGPKTYPIGFSLIEAYLYKSFGYSDFLFISKFMMLASLAVILFYQLRLFAERDGWQIALITTILFAAAPYVFDMKDQVRGDLIFVAILYWLFWYHGRQLTAYREGHRFSWKSALGIGILLYLAITMRSLAIVILPALIAYDILCLRRIRFQILLTIAVATGIYLLQSTLVGSGAKGYQGEFALTIGSLIDRVMVNLTNYYYVFSEYLSFGTPALGGLSKLLLLASLLFFGLGLAVSLRRGIRLHDIFFPVYFCLLLSHETVSAWARYMLPIMPIYFYYMLVGSAALSSRFGIWIARGSQFGLVAFVLASFATVYWNWTEFGEYEHGPLGGNFLGAQEMIAQHSTDTDVIMARSPHWTYLILGRKVALSPGSGCCGDAASKDNIRSYLQKSGTTMVLIKETPRKQVGFYALNRWDKEEATDFRNWVMTDQNLFQEISVQAPYRLYRVTY